MRVAIVGAGPAGSQAACELAGRGIEAVLFDPSFDREKPCGGGVPWRGLREYEGLLDPDLPSCAVSRVLFDAPSGRSVEIELPRPIRIYSRRALDARWADRARRAGATLRRERVVGLERRQGRGAGSPSPAAGSAERWVVRSSSGSEEPFDHVIGADGARSQVRQAVGVPFKRDDLTQAVGYYVPGNGADTARISFDSELRGYLWSFPRLDHFAVGACAPLDQGGAAHLREITVRYLRRLDPSFDPSGHSFYSALIPTLSAGALDANAVCGPGWSLVGDAAGTVDPLTREGIYYGLKSSSLAAEAIAGGRPEDYSTAWSRTFAPEFLWAAKRRERFFDPDLTDQLVRALDRSRAVRRIMVDMLLGEQSYLTLKRRLFASAVPAALQWAIGKTLGR